MKMNNIAMMWKLFWISIVLAVFLSGFVGMASAEDWQEFRPNSMRAGYFGSVAQCMDNVLCSHNAGVDLTSSPVVAGNVFAGSSGEMAGYRLATCSKLWGQNKVGFLGY